MRYLIAVLALFVAAGAARGQDSLRAEQVNSVSTEELRGFSFGVGLGMSIDLGKDNPVQRAEVVGGIVRVLEEKSAVPRFLLESHYFFVPGSGFLGIPKDHWGLGPFVAIQSGSNAVIEVLGTGLMIGFRQTRVVKGDADAPEQVQTNSFNFGVGIVLDSKATVLRDGVEENKTPPPGEEGELLKKTSRWGLLIAFSFAF